MEAIRKIDVGVAGGAEDDAGAWGDAGDGVGGEVRLAEVGLDVGFGFYDAGDSIAMVDELAEEIAGHDGRITGVKLAGEGGYNRADEAIYRHFDSGWNVGIVRTGVSGTAFIGGWVELVAGGEFAHYD